MENLPALEFIKHPEPYDEISTNKIFDITSPEEYEKFLEEFSECVGADCWAVTLDGIVIYSLYKEDHFIEDIIRAPLYKYPRDFIDPIISRTKDTRLILYMFGTTPWFIFIDCDTQTKKMTTTHYVSQAYIEKFKHVQ